MFFSRKDMWASVFHITYAKKESSCPTGDSATRAVSWADFFPAS